MFVKFPITGGVLYNEGMLPENEYTTFENRKYINPQVSLDEQNTFIDNLRTTQQANNEQITAQTEKLGTEVPSNLGGLVGSSNYWTSRYQVPQTASAIADLRATAQAKALNDVLSNQETMWKNRYNKAYQNYQTRSWNKSNGGGGNGGGGSSDPTDPYKQGETETIIDKDTPQGSTEEVGTVDDGEGVFTMNPKMQYSYELNGKTYYITVYGRTTVDPSRDKWWITATTDTWPYTQHFKGTKGLDFLNSVIERGGKIYNASGAQVSPKRVYELEY